MFNETMRGIGMTSQRTRDRLVTTLREMGIKNELVLSIVASTPRHLFMDEALSSRAYENKSLPIGHGQTISQPYIVAKMTELILGDIDRYNDKKAQNYYLSNGQISAELKIRKVLEVGTGSGYQTAILAPFSRSIYTVERILPLLEKARTKFRQTRLNNILTHHTDGCWGWKERAPFDAIIVTAAPCEMQLALLDQLTDNGKLVIPVGPEGKQELHYYEKIDGEINHKVIEEVSFVPLLSGKI